MLLALALGVLGGCRGVLGISELAIDAGAEDAGARDGAVDGDAAATNDAGADGADGATTDGGCDAGVAPSLNGDLVPCPGGECAARQDTCCLGPSADAGLCLQTGNSCGVAAFGSVVQQCVRNGQCADGYYCCLTLKNFEPNTCPPSGELAQSVCNPSQTCDGQIELCSPTGDTCHGAAKTCRPLQITLPRPILVGACL